MKKLTHSLVRAALLACAVVLTACGGGSSDSLDATSSAAASELRGRSGNQSTAQKLTVSLSGSGAVSSSPSGISCGSLCSASFSKGTSVTLTATPDAGHDFSGWSGACTATSGTCTVAMSAAKSVKATFTVTAAASASTYLLSVTTAGSGNGTVTSSAGGISCSSGTCTASLVSGSSVTLTAAPASGYTFSGWSGACSGTSTSCTVVMSAAESATATFNASTSSTACAPTSASTALASVITNSSGSLTTNTVLNQACAADTSYGRVNGNCYGSYAVQPNVYQTPPASTNFSMWSNSASCWGINLSEPTNSNSLFWSAPQVTRGFSFGFSGLLTSTGGAQVSGLNTKYASATTPCPASGSSESVCAKWSMSVPGVSAQSQTNTAANTYSKWNALMDIYFHATAKPAIQQNTTFDLQIYQMVMDYTAGSVPNWATYIVGTYTTKTIGGVTYLVSVNMGDPGTEGSGWVGNGGSYNSISMFPLPTFPTTKASGGTGSYLWGQASLLHDVGGIIAWLSQPKTVNGVTGIFDDSGKLLYDNVRKANVTSALLNPSFYLTGFNPGYEVVTATPSSTYTNNTVFTTTDFWVAMPGETIGN